MSWVHKCLRQLMQTKLSAARADRDIQGAFFVFAVHQTATAFADRDIQGAFLCLRYTKPQLHLLTATSKVHFCVCGKPNRNCIRWPQHPRWKFCVCGASNRNVVPQT